MKSRPPPLSEYRVESALLHQHKRFDRGVATLRVVWAALLGWMDDRCSSLAAALAFYALFSLAPMLLVIVSIAGYLFGAEATTGQLYGQLRSVFGPEAATFVQFAVESAWKSRASTSATIFSVIAIIVGASVTFAELKVSLNTVFRSRAAADIPLLLSTWTLVKARVLSFALVTGLAFLLIISLVLDAGVAALQHFVIQDMQFAVIFQVLEKSVSLVLLTFMFAVLLQVLPDTHVPVRAAALGGACASILFVLGKSLFALYLTSIGTTDVFGAAGSLAVVLMWLFYSSAVFLFGAEIAREVSIRINGSDAVPTQGTSISAATKR
ncbi:MAG: YihY/virulence factor BrkB family protein [Casimicrobium sp.]|jgi:membrane protein